MTTILLTCTPLVGNVFLFSNFLKIILRRPPSSRSSFKLKAEVEAQAAGQKYTSRGGGNFEDPGPFYYYGEVVPGKPDHLREYEFKNGTEKSAAFPVRRG